MNSSSPESVERQEILRVLAGYSPADLAEAWAAWDPKPGMEVIRAPEFGLVMARGRVGGGGDPFNLGEVTVTRASVRLETGEIGHGHVLGRDREHALLVARFDALWQSNPSRNRVESDVIRPGTTRRTDADKTTQRQSAATRVNFFTMVRGED